MFIDTAEDTSVGIIRADDSVTLLGVRPQNEFFILAHVEVNCTCPISSFRKRHPSSYILLV